MYRNIIPIIFLMCLSVAGYATHLRAGVIIVERLTCTSLTFRVTVTVYTNTYSEAVFGGDEDWLDFGDGNRMLVPITPNTLRPDLGTGVGTASFTTTHTYSGYGNYIVSYSEPNRNAGVLNMDGSVNTRFYVETKVLLDPFFGCNNAPTLKVPPIDRGCVGVAFQHNPGPVDPDGDSLSFELVIPFRDRGTQVFNYRGPDDPSFYTNYETGNEAGTGRPTLIIDPVEGTLTWDAPGMSGEYNIAFVIKEWRKIDGKWYSNGFVRRDMQIIVDECDNERPDLEIPEDICVEAGTTLDAVITGTDPDGDPVKIEAFSEIFNFAPAQSPATYTPNDGEFRAVPAQLTFQWNTECAHVKAQPYQVVFKITDLSPTGSRLVTFKSWFITVVGPKPVWVDAQVDLATRSANLEWDPYLCQNADSIEVWRKVDSFQFVPDNCETGMPGHLGYSLIATVPVKDANGNPITTFSDTNGGRGLAAGAEYCYRLVAQFPLPRGGESYVSEEICIDPILADAPIITNVTIDRSATDNGQITVRWARPFDLDRIQFPGNLQYELYRAEGYAGNGNIKLVHPGRLAEADTVFVDTEPGLNTRDIVYNYRVVLYTDEFPAPIDTSTTASTVRLEAQSEIGRITLNWSAVVPWSNIIVTEPNEHVLYRGPAGADESQLQELAVIDPTAGGLVYVDEGLSDTEEYCYRVMTRGAYGNPRIPEPLENFSQIVCAQPNDSIPPCTPILSVQLSDCEKFFQTEACGQGTFKNVLSWNRPDVECAADILGYKIYRAAEIDGIYIWLSEAGPNGNGIITDTTFTDNGVNNTGLTSLAYCYRVSAIDRSNNESELSDPVCNDNCPYYELPNVFTPDGDGCNDLFSAFSNRSLGGEGSDCPKVDTQTRCARFVRDVVFRVYNRWGKEVYNYESGGERTIYIDWDGRANDGSELASGIYYYVAEVTFDAVNPETRDKTIKGWVHLTR